MFGVISDHFKFGLVFVVISVRFGFYLFIDSGLLQINQGKNYFP